MRASELSRRLELEQEVQQLARGKAKLEEEREQRTGTEEVLLKLLDDTCNRLESGAV